MNKTEIKNTINDIIDILDDLRIYITEINQFDENGEIVKLHKTLDDVLFNTDPKDIYSISFEKHINEITGEYIPKIKVLLN